MSEAFPGPRPLFAYHTHPKLNNVQQVQNDIQTAIEKAFRPHPSIYKEVTVLLLHFDNDDIGVSGLEDELAATFKDFYGFRVRRRYLNGTSGMHPAALLTSEFARMEKEGLLGKDCLLLLVFSGHGELRTEARSPTRDITVLHVGGALDRNIGAIKGRSLEWRGATQMLDHSDADIVQILDCCYAAEAGRPSMEMLAATSGNEIAASSPDTCFTKGLITELRNHASKSITITGLHKAMMDNRAALGLEHTPFYDPRPGDKPSILLTSRANNIPKVNVLRAPTDNARAVITVHLTQSLTKEDVERLKKWLTTSIPAAVKKINFSLDGYHESGSGILTISLPIEVWSQLPANPAYSFVGFARSANLLLGLAAPPAQVLAIRPLGENIKPGTGSSKN